MRLGHLKGRPMLRATFQHLPTVGAPTEALLWGRGLRDWEDLARAEHVPGISPPRLASLRQSLAGTERAFKERDGTYFARRLPYAEHWRLYSAFASRTAFLDIETTGLSPHHGIVTCVTVHGGGRTRSFVQGDDLEEVSAFLAPYALLVTFNGLQFDVPFLEASLEGFRAPPAHADLRFLLRRLGQRGGLKIIERRLGLGRRDGVEGVDGLEAVRLWESYRAGRRDALDRLVAYNRADTVNLEPLMDYACREMERRLLHRAGDETIRRPTSESRLDPAQRILAVD